ncbi:MAG: hypothetical protein ACOC4R_00505 [Bacteroidota bacterium]
MNEIHRLINIIETIREKITDDADVVWSGYGSALELKEDIDRDLIELKQGNLDILDKFMDHFLPTAAFQEIAITNGWDSEFLDFAEEYEQLYKKTAQQAGGDNKLS